MHPRLWAAIILSIVGAKQVTSINTDSKINLEAGITIDTARTEWFWLHLYGENLANIIYLR